MNNKPKHTPGPWRFNSATMDVETLDGGTVAFPRTGGCLSGDFESKIRANARLIAAAPEMLEVLEKLLNSLLDPVENTRLSVSEVEKEYWTMSKLNEAQLKDLFKDYLDRVYGLVNIAGIGYSTSHCLECTDPALFDHRFQVWLDQQVDKSIVKIDGEYFDNIVN